MGGLAAILRWDGAPVADDEVRRVARASAHRGIDGISVRSAAALPGPAPAFAYLRFATT